MTAKEGRHFSLGRSDLRTILISTKRFVLYTRKQSAITLADSLLYDYLWIWSQLEHPQFGKDPNARKKKHCIKKGTNLRVVTGSHSASVTVLPPGRTLVTASNSSTDSYDYMLRCVAARGTARQLTDCTGRCREVCLRREVGEDG